MPNFFILAGPERRRQVDLGARAPERRAPCRRIRQDGEIGADNLKRTTLLGTRAHYRGTRTSNTKNLGL